MNNIVDTSSAPSPSTAPLTARQRHGRTLIRAAWGLEIIAAAIGLFIALAVAFDTLQEIEKKSTTQSTIEESDWLANIESSVWLDTFIGALPFLMVAIVELMKIPLATAFYLSKPLVWRCIFLISLVLLVTITFETMLNGFQRQYERRVFVITEQRATLTSIEERIKRHDDRIRSLLSVTAESVRDEYSEDFDKIQQQQNLEISKIDEQRQEHIRTLDAKADVLHQNELNDIRARLERLRSDEQQELSNYTNSNKYDNSGIANKRSEYINRIESLERNLSRISEERKLELSDCTFSCSRIRSTYNKREDNINRQIRDARNRLNSLDDAGDREQYLSRIEEGKKIIRQKYRPQIMRLEERIQELSAKIDEQRSRSARSVDVALGALDRKRQEIGQIYQTRIDEIEDRLQKRMEEVTKKEQEIGKLQDEISKEKRRRDTLRDQINRDAKNNQIYQIAALWYGKDSRADVTQDELKVVSLVWFGSLAFIVATMGVIIALAGLVLRYHERPTGAKVDPSATTAALRSVRRAAVAYRRRLRARPPPPKIEVREVMKEVPVDKVVFRDVPKEVVVKELVYVPLYTSDPSLLNIDYGVGVVKPSDGRTESPREDRAARTPE